MSLGYKSWSRLVFRLRLEATSLLSGSGQEWSGGMFAGVTPDLFWVFAWFKECCSELLAGVSYYDLAPALFIPSIDFFFYKFYDVYYCIFSCWSFCSYYYAAKTLASFSSCSFFSFISLSFSSLRNLLASSFSCCSFCSWAAFSCSFFYWFISICFETFSTTLL